ncbi:50S ribosomal protein L29 [Candidatus Peregrinibacteria bacterium RIFOXYB2_FULL_32_7]|nr:MAG: 50S ribosomal protein L29 [Candidatus Peregrinibacteria bacterium RIFOXYB2_FULL_32_7]
MLTYAELQNSEIKELMNFLTENKRELLKLRLSAKSGQLKANHKIKNIKKYVAQISTALNSKKIKSN